MPAPSLPFGSPGTTTTLGSDFSGIDDLDSAWTFLENSVTSANAETVACAQALARRLSTPFGGNPDDPNYGLDVRDFLSSGVSPSSAQAQIEAECRKEERVADCRATIDVSGDFNAETWLVTVVAQSLTGAVFQLTIAVTSVTMQLITVGP